MVGLVAPGGMAEDALIEKCVRNLEGMGFSVKPGRHLRAVHGNYAGSVAQRAEDLHAMFADREVAGIWAARGGSGCTALLPLLDYAAIRRNAKVLVGFSDITALHLALLRKAGLVTFHGKVASSTFSDFSVEHLRSVLMEPRARAVLPIAPENLEKARQQAQFAPRVFRPGRAQGRLVGGNLSTLAAMVGTPYGAVTGGAILFLEEVAEAPYRIDRMLTQLRQSGDLSRAAGVVLGVFEKCEAPVGEASLSLGETLEQHLDPLRVPAAYGFSFGHIEHQVTLPVGVMAQLDTDQRTITLLEAAVTL